MTFAFPFAGARGAFFHAGAALQPMFWSLAPLGLESILESLQKRGIGHSGNRFVFRSALIMVTMILTVYVVYYKLVNIGWGEGEDADYPVIEQVLLQNGIRDDDIVIVRNAPGYYLATGRSAISIPYGGEEAITRRRRTIRRILFGAGARSGDLSQSRIYSKTPKDAAPSTTLVNTMARASTNSTSNKLSPRDLFILSAAVVLIALVYLLASQFTYGIGFPLDDLWIHQTYARNLAQHGEWAFRPGIPSAGSTAPLWSALLALGFLLRLSPYIWTYLLGMVTLFALAVLCEWAVRELVVFVSSAISLGWDFLRR